MSARTSVEAALWAGGRWLPTLLARHWDAIVEASSPCGQPGLGLEGRGHREGFSRRLTSQLLADRMSQWTERSTC